MYNMGNILWWFTIVGFIVVLVILSIVWSHSRSKGMIEQWATENGLHLVDSSYCWFKIGTPFWAANKNHTLYRVTMQDDSGHLMLGYALCGSFFMGLLSDRVEVKWDDETVEKLKNDTIGKLKNDFIKRKNEW